MPVIWTVILKNGEKWSFAGPHDAEPTLLQLEQEGVVKDSVAALIRGDMVSRTEYP